MNINNGISVSIIGPYPPPFGGVSVHIKRLNQALREIGVPSLVYDTSNLSKERKIDKNENVENVGLNSRYIWFNWLLKHGLRNNSSIIHCHDGWVWCFPMFIMQLMGKKIVMTFHDENTLEKWKKTPIVLRKFDQFLFNSSNVVWIAVNDNIKKQLVSLGAFEKKVSVIPAFIAPNEGEFEALPESLSRFLETHTPIITTYGWTNAFDKDGNDVYGFDLCIELTKRMIKDYPGIGMVISIPRIHDQNKFEILKNTAIDLQTHVYFLLKPINDLTPLLKRSNLFLRTTNTDGDSLSIREALRLNIPVVASDVVNRPPGTILFRNRDINDLYQMMISTMKEDINLSNIIQPDSINIDFFSKILNLYNNISH